MDIDEACSRTALRAYQGFPKQAELIENGRAWLLRIAYNVCMDLHRERKRRCQVSLDNLSSHEIEGRLGECVKASDSDPEITLLEYEGLRLLRDLIGRLPARLRHMTELHVYEDMSYPEIARNLGITEVNVRKRMQETRHHLRRLYKTPSVSRSLLETASEAPSSEHSGPPRGGGQRPGSWRAGGIDRHGREHDVGVVALEVFERPTEDGFQEVLLPLVELPSSCHRKRITGLERYIEKHPGGWKKRLALGRVLCGARRLKDALPHYHYVVRKRPFLLAPWCELAAALQALGRDDEVAEILALGARRVGRSADRNYIEGLEAACQGAWAQARDALRAAALVTGENRHWRSLGMACLAAGWRGEAIRAFEQVLVSDSNDLMTLLLVQRLERFSASRVFELGVLLLSLPNRETKKIHGQTWDLV